MSEPKNSTEDKLNLLIGEVGLLTKKIEDL
jgi:hypothetical protein